MSDEFYRSNLSESEIVFYGLLYNDDVCVQVMPYIKNEYMPESFQKTIFDLLESYHKRYSKTPSAQELKIALGRMNLSDTVFEPAIEMIEEIEVFEQKKTKPIYTQWLVDHTESWVRNRAFHNVVMKSITCIEEGSDPTHAGLTKEMEEALAITFDTSIGHELFEAAEIRYDSYHAVEDKVAFILSKFNAITKGGLNKKTLSCFISNRTGGFKSGTMCHLTADNLRLGYNVLYLTAEMSELKIGERVDSNLLNTDIDDLRDIPKQNYLNRLDQLKEKYTGSLVVKEFATSTAHAGHIRYLLKELRRKKGFVPDIVYFDYLNIFASENLPPSARQNSYLWIKSIAEEFRALAHEFNFAGVTATQSNREGTGSSEIDLKDTSESIGLPNILDLFLAVIRTPDMDEADEILFQQIKNRYSDESFHRKFKCGVRMSRMQLYDIEGTFDSQNKSHATLSAAGATTKPASNIEKFVFDD